MCQASHANQKFPYMVLVALRRASASLVVVLSFFVVTWAFQTHFNELYHALLIIAALLALILLPGAKQQRSNLVPHISSISISVATRWSLLILVLLLLGYATKTSAIFSRKALFAWFIVTPPLIVLVQAAIEILIARMLLSAGNIRKAVIAGAGDLGQKLAINISSSPMLGAELEGFFDDRGEERLPNASSFSLLGKLKDLPDYVRAHNTDLIFITLPIRNIQRVTELLDHLHDTTASIYFVPDIFVFDLIQCRTADIDGLPAVALCETPFQGTHGMIKTASDYVIAALVLMLTSPLMIAIALAIKLTSAGSVIFKQRRYGLDGREIIVYKFRTMTVAEDSDDIRQATRNDGRVTRVGAFLRKYSLDELPQFINVLQGRMSVVGPRPHAVTHNEQYRPLIKGYMVRHKVNPGITGLAQVSGYRGETKTVDAMRDRVKYDLEYLRNWSLSLDLQIILRTLRIMFKDDMAY
jgi:putative colanic acid biosynthesis UDP-glucose lipid carrier transferase